VIADYRRWSLHPRGGPGSWLVEAQRGRLRTASRRRRCTGNDGRGASKDQRWRPSGSTGLMWRGAKSFGAARHRRGAGLPAYRRVFPANYLKVSEILQKTVGRARHRRHHRRQDPSGTPPLTTRA